MESASPHWAEELLGASLQIEGESDPTEFDSWPIADRNLALLDVFRAQFGDSAHVVARCPEASCDARLDVDFEIEELIELGATASMQVELDGQVLPMRSPTGRELRRWRVEEQSFVRDVLEFMVGRELSDEQLPQLAPQVLSNLAGPRFELPVQCSICEVDFAVAIELSSLFQERMAQRMEDLEHEIHLLALHYHWSEDEILSLPCHRRKRYVQRLGETWS